MTLNWSQNNDLCYLKSICCLRQRRRYMSIQIKTIMPDKRYVAHVVLVQLDMSIATVGIQFGECVGRSKNVNIFVHSQYGVTITYCECIWKAIFDGITYTAICFRRQDISQRPFCWSEGANIFCLYFVENVSFQLTLAKSGAEGMSVSRSLLFWVMNTVIRHRRLIYVSISHWRIL